MIKRRCSGQLNGSGLRTVPGQRRGLGQLPCQRLARPSGRRGTMPHPPVRIGDRDLRQRRMHAPAAAPH
jgi:hypothetical protein